MFYNAVMNNALGGFSGDVGINLAANTASYLNRWNRWKFPPLLLLSRLSPVAPSLENLVTVQHAIERRA